LLRVIKPAIFVGSSRRDLQCFPRKVRQELGQALFEAQLGESGTYCAVYTVRFEGILYVLHAFQKKSTKGIATPQRHLDRLRQRLRDAETLHKGMKGAKR
jgi:phage-related protein